MTSKEFKLEFEALLFQGLNGNGYLHYGYWEEGVADKMTLCRMGIAQQAYFDELARAIPDGIHSILDVGSGTGGNALGLLKKGYAVDCVCPSPKLNRIAREKLPETSRIFESRFEDLELGSDYDLMIFSESFHYLDAEKALRKMCAHARSHIIVFDYFPRADSVTSLRVSHSQFTKLVTGTFSDKLRIVSDRDVSTCIVPTFQVLDEFKNHYVQPFVKRTIADYRRAHPFYSFLFAWPMRKILAKVQKKNDRASAFLDTYEYHLILLASAAESGRSSAYR